MECRNKKEEKYGRITLCYLEHLQCNTQQTKQLYKRNECCDNDHNKSWEKFRSKVEEYVNGRQLVA